MKYLTWIILVSIVGCKGEVKTTDDFKDESIVRPAIESKVEAVSKIAPQLITVESFKPEMAYLSPIAENALYSVTGNIINGTSLDVYGSKIYSVVDELKSLSDYTIELGIQHQYNSWLCIELSNDYFLTGFYRKGEWSWSDLIPECSYGMGLPYTFNDLLVMYGYEEVKLGRNFELNLMREKSWSVKWLIQAK